MNLKAQKRVKNNIVHIYDDDADGRSSVCGSCKRNGTTRSVERDTVIDNEYLVVDGNIIGKFCGNCSMTLTGTNFEQSRKP